MRAFQLIDITLDPLHDSLGLKSIDCLLLETVLICHFFDILPIEAFVVRLSFLAHFEQFVDISSKLVAPKDFFIDYYAFCFD